MTAHATSVTKRLYILLPSDHSKAVWGAWAVWPTIMHGSNGNSETTNINDTQLMTLILITNIFALLCYYNRPQNLEPSDGPNSNRTPKKESL